MTNECKKMKKGHTTVFSDGKFIFLCCVIVFFYYMMIHIFHSNIEYDINKYVVIQIKHCVLVIYNLKFYDDGPFEPVPQDHPMIDIQQ